MPNPFIRKLDCRFTLSEADKSTLKQASAQTRRIAAGVDLISEGDAPNNVHLIQSGFACRYKVLPDGGRSIVAYLVPGDIADLHVSILGVMDHSIATLSACEVVVISQETMDDLSANHPVIDRALRWAGLVDESILREWLVGMGRRPAHQQVAHILCELLVRLEAVGLAPGNSYELPITQGDLADMAGLSNIHVNRVLQDLRGQGLIVSKGKTLSIPDVECLKAFAKFNPNYLHLEPKQRDLHSQSGAGQHP